jgi:hypothetical protein
MLQFKIICALIENTEFQHFGGIFENWRIVLSQLRLIMEFCQKGLMLCSSPDRIHYNDIAIHSVPIPI